MNSLFVASQPLACGDEANISKVPEGIINLTDLTLLISHRFFTFEPLPDCP